MPACCGSFLQPSASAHLRGQVKNGPCVLRFVFAAFCKCTPAGTGEERTPKCMYLTRVLLLVFAAFCKCTPPETGEERTPTCMHLYLRAAVLVYKHVRGSRLTRFSRIPNCTLDLGRLRAWTLQQTNTADHHPGSLFLHSHTETQRPHNKAFPRRSGAATNKTQRLKQLGVPARDCFTSPRNFRHGCRILLSFHCGTGNGTRRCSCTLTSRSLQSIIL